jgi:hypothetical protein
MFTKCVSTWAAAFCLELFACGPCRKNAEHEIGVIKSAGFICLALFLPSLATRAQENDPGASPSPTPARPSRPTSLTDAVAEAKRLNETEEGKRYDFEFSTTVSDRIGDIVGQCTKDSKPPVVFDLVFVFAGDGHVANVLHPPDSAAAACVAAKFKNLRLRAPPQPDWPVQLHIELRSPPEERDASGKPYPLEPAVITKDRELERKALRAERENNLEQALLLYEKAIKVKGNFAPFAYQNRGMLYLHRAKASQDTKSKIADLERAIADFKASIKLGAAAKDQLNRGLEKISTRANLEEATKLLEEETRH